LEAARSCLYLAPGDVAPGDEGAPAIADAQVGAEKAVGCAWRAR